jgi:hypothetical protein
MMSDSYSNTYTEARQKFLTLVSQREAMLISRVHPTEWGAEGEELAIDIAVFGDHDAEKTLFLISGTHGQEGFYGSALQIEFLRDLEIPEGINVAALHGLNPWGFSHLSRTDNQNIDVNRNFTDYGIPSERDEIYPPLFRALCPDDWTEDTIDWSKIRDELTQEYGTKRLVSAAGGGQMIEPTGMNYIGTGPSWSRTVVEEELPKIFAKSKKVAFIEWHTGLGDYGKLSHIPMMKSGSAGHERMFEWLGEDARSTWTRGMGDFNGVTPDYRGWFSAWLPSCAPQADWAGMVIEAGTYGVVEVMDGIRIDRWLKFGKGRSCLSRDEMREIMMDKLYPTAPDWRAAALKNGVEAQQCFFEGLQRW